MVIKENYFDLLMIISNDFKIHWTAEFTIHFIKLLALIRAVLGFIW